jgi:hypothetical protein
VLRFAWKYSLKLIVITPLRVLVVRVALLPGAVLLRAKYDRKIAAPAPTMAYDMREIDPAMAHSLAARCTDSISRAA